LVTEERVRAILHESSIALRHWWGVGTSTTERWRRRFGVGRMDSEGSRRLILNAIGTSVVARGDAQSKQEHEVPWSDEQVALVGVLPDEEIAAKTGRTLNSVKLKRHQLGRPIPGRHRIYMVPWTLEQDQLAMSLPAEEVAARTGHTVGAIRTRKVKLRKAGRTQ
jgi:hypothetical protein